jgi:chitinase
MLVGLRDKNPDLKVMLSIGGWGSGNFSEMAASEANRKSFANDCLRVIEEFQLDGIDIDWEYPTSNSAGISSSPNDTANYTLLMKEIRSSIGTNKLLTLASQAGAGFIDFASLEPIVDFVNIMTYDMGNPPKHHAPLYRSENVGWLSCEEGINKHIAAGIPAHKLTFGIPFYGHGMDGIPRYVDYKNILKLKGNYIQKWDEDACVPYLADKDGKFICTYETPQSIAIKCKYLKKKGMLGAMYWDYNADDEQGSLRNAVYQGVMK